MLFNEVVETSARAAATGSRTAKVASLAETLGHAGGDELEILAHYLSGSLRQRRTGVGWRSLATPPPRAPPAKPSLTLTEVDAAFGTLGRARRAGVRGARAESIAG